MNKGEIEHLRLRRFFQIRFFQIFLLVSACLAGSQVQALAQAVSTSAEDLSEAAETVETPEAIDTPEAAGTPEVSDTQVATAPLRPALLQESLPNLPPIEPILPEVTPEIRLVLKLGERKIYVYREGELYASYPVAVGRPGWETPTGQYQIIQMIPNPGWTNPFTGERIPPGPESPLGERWIAFWTDGSDYIGFHGTPNPETVGYAASHGCVRMYNQDVRELYDLVSLGTPVIVEP